MLAGLCGRHRQAGVGRGGDAARATAMTTTATGDGWVEEEMEGEVEREEREEACWPVLVIEISIIHSNNTYFTSISLLE